MAFPHVEAPHSRPFPCRSLVPKKFIPEQKTQPETAGSNPLKYLHIAIIVLFIVLQSYYSIQNSLILKSILVLIRTTWRGWPLGLPCQTVVWYSSSSATTTSTRRRSPKSSPWRLNSVLRRNLYGAIRIENLKSHRRSWSMIFWIGEPLAVRRKPPAKRKVHFLPPPSWG